MGEISFACKFCGGNVNVRGEAWDEIVNGALFHFSACAPPRRGVPTSELFREAERLAREFGAKGGNRTPKT